MTGLSSVHLRTLYCVHCYTYSFFKDFNWLTIGTFTHPQLTNQDLNKNYHAITQMSIYIIEGHVLFYSLYNIQKEKSCRLAVFNYNQQAHKKF